MLRCNSAAYYHSRVRISDICPNSLRNLMSYMSFFTQPTHFYGSRAFNHAMIGIYSFNQECLKSRKLA